MPIRWGILGCGDVAEHKGGPALYRPQGSELVAVMRRDAAKAADFARRHGAKRSYDTADALLADREIDAVYIATPPHLHAEQTVAAARAGKHVLVEKPMAISGAECETMIAACRSAGVHLHVAYYRRFFPKFIAAKEMLDNGAIGEIVGAQLTLCDLAPMTGWRNDPAMSPGGQFMDVGSHRLDMLCHMLGGVDLTAISGYGDSRHSPLGAVNDAVFSLRMRSGALASASFHMATLPSKDTLTIYGTGGSLLFDPFDSETFTVTDAHGSQSHTFARPNPSHLPFVEALIAIYNGADIPHVTGEKGAQASRIIEVGIRFNQAVPR